MLQQAVNMIGRFRWVLVPVVFAVALLSVLVLFNGSRAPDKQASQLGGNFTLQSASGPVSLSDFRGKVVIIYFGYTFCPDVCPTSLALLTLALNELNETELQQVQPIFISVDPERDTVAKLKTYVESFHPSLIGLTDTPLTIASVAQDYGVMYMKVKTPNSAMGYTVDHSSFYYLVGRDGMLKRSILHGTDPAEIAEAIRAVLNKPYSLE